MNGFGASRFEVAWSPLQSAIQEGCASKKLYTIETGFRGGSCATLLRRIKGGVRALASRERPKTSCCHFAQQLSLGLLGAALTVSALSRVRRCHTAAPWSVSVLPSRVLSPGRE